VDTVDASYVVTILAAIGVPREAHGALLAEVGLPDNALRGGERLPSEAVYTLFARMAEGTSDPWIGLTVASRAVLDRGAIGVVTQACSNRPTLGEALAHLPRLIRLVDTVSAFFVEERGDEVDVGFRMSTSLDAQRFALQFGVATIFLAARRATLTPLVPLAVHFVDAPGVTDRGEVPRALFGAPVTLGASASFFVLPVAALREPLAAADGALATALAGYVDEQLREIGRGGPGWSARARRAIAENLARDVTLPALATHLATSARTLQRRLAEEGVTVEGLVEETRRAMAERYLGEGHTVAEVAFLLGYTDAPTFSRAFKRWHGVSPGRRNMPTR
jgi:AraC-like DNA-binding protein